ncbi:MAG: CvpA family protein [Gammaproteobacteria bacterium]|nr:CvpA family protein [Gammaproteobacteria bacterium]
MTGIDVVILLFIGISGVISWFRGVTREFISLFTWVLAIAVTFLYSHKFAIILPDSIGGVTARVITSALILFFGILLLGWLFGTLAKKFLATVKMSVVDRILGLLFGLLRGIAIISVIVLLLNLTGIPQEPWWHESFFLPRFQQIAMWLHEHLPPDLAAYFKFS